MAEQKTLKTKNKAEFIGYLKEVNLEKKKNDDKENFISGVITLKYGEKPNQQVDVKIYKKELTSGGSVAKAYEKLMEIMEHGVTVDTATEEKTATVVRIYGNGDFTPQVVLNEYFREDESHVMSPQAEMGFGNMAINSVGEQSFKAEFDMEIILSKDPIMEKDKNDDETGRLVVDGYMVTYKNEIKPMSFVAEDQDLVDGMVELSKGDMVNIWGNVSTGKIVEVQEKKSGFGGKAKTDETITYVNELVITGGEPIESDDKRAEVVGSIKKMLGERETLLDELKNKKSESKPKSGGFSKPSETKTKKNKDVPF